MQQSFFTISFIWKAHWLELSLHAEHGLLVARVTDWCSDAAANELVISAIMQCSSQKHGAVFHAGWIKLHRTQLEQMNDNVVPQCNEQTLAHICGWTSECHSLRTALIGSLSVSSHVHTLLWLRRDHSSGMNQSLSLCLSAFKLKMLWFRRTESHFQVTESWEERRREAHKAIVFLLCPLT